MDNSKDNIDDFLNHFSQSFDFEEKKSSEEISNFKNFKEFLIEIQKDITKEEKLQSYFEIGKNKSRHHQKNQRLRRQKQKNKIFLSLHTKEDYIDYINTKKFEKQAQINNALKGLESGIKIIIDCSYENSMKKKEINSLCTQICLICAQMKRVEIPLCINLTKINTETLENLKKIGISNWAINVFSEDFLDIEIFKTRKHDLIYLTPDSENIIENIEENKIYIVGGIVDRTVKKNLSFDRAQTLGIKTAKLPINCFMNENRRVPLNVDSIVLMISDFLKTKNWQNSFFNICPKRIWKIDHK